MEDHAGKHILVSGKVQGVFFRASTRDQARALGVTGWVRNLESGEVEIMAFGPLSAITEFVAWCHQGPVLSRVDRLVIQDVACESFHDFDIRY